MSETGFGPGGYAYTAAETPAAPVLTEDTSTSLRICPGSDGNPPHTVYALFNETDGVYLDADGVGTPFPVWRTKTEWGVATAAGLAPATEYVFALKARNADGVETAFGQSASCVTHGLASVILAAVLEVRKASSTITAPPFMSALGAGIRIAGKDLHDFGFHADSIGGLDMPRIMPDEEFIPGSHSWRIRDEYFAPKYIVLEGFVHGSSSDDLRLRLAYLKSFLATFEGRPWRSSAPVRLERADLPDRHWKAYYDSIELVEMLGSSNTSPSARVKIVMKCPSPFAESNETVRVTFTAAAGTFRTIDLGNAPSETVYVIGGESSEPAFVIGDMVFFCDFRDGLVYTDAGNEELTGLYTPPGNEAGAYRTTETGTGIFVTGTDTVSYTANGNPADGSWVVAVAPQWQSSAQTGDVTILEHRTDADNYLRLWWDGSEQAWVFTKRANGTDRSVASGFQAFTAGTRIILGVTYDSTNAGGMKIFVDGCQAGVGGDFGALAAAPSALTLHAGDGTMQPDAVYDLVAGWSRMLSADEMMKIASDPSAVMNRNTVFAYGGTLAAGDRLTIDSERKTAELFDVSEGTRTNALDDIAGSIPALTPGRRRTATDRTQTVIYMKSAADSMEVRYRRRYL